MKSRKIAFTLFAGFTLIIFSYFFYCINFLVDDSYTVMEGANLDSRLPPGISVCEDTLEAGKNPKTSGTVGTREVKIEFLGLVSAGKVSVNTVARSFVYPSGECVGIKMYSRGLVVSGFTDFETDSGICVSPGAVAGLKEGDIIYSINGVKTSSVNEFVSLCDSTEDICTLGVERDDKSLSLKATPSLCTDGHKRLGIYVKNSVAGVGTMTYTTEDSSLFGALGHGISDSGTLVPLNSASVYRADIIDVKKGQKGSPGEIIGAIDEAQLIGEGTKNSPQGVYGVLSGYIPKGTPMEALSSDKVAEGKAQILCTASDEDRVEAFDVEIVSVNHLRKNKTKSFAIKVTDERLLGKTGGIIQGMSGSPVIQNGKIAGAVTHVFVNDPTRGYGIFIENMLAEANKIK